MKSKMFAIPKLENTPVSTSSLSLFGPRRDKTCLPGFQQSETQTSLLSYRD